MNLLTETALDPIGQLQRQVVGLVTAMVGP